MSPKYMHGISPRQLFGCIDMYTIYLLHFDLDYLINYIHLYKYSIGDLNSSEARRAAVSLLVASIITALIHRLVQA